VDLTKICKIQPLGVNHNYKCIADLDSIDIKDLKADDVGSWKGKRTPCSHFDLDDYGIPIFHKSKYESKKETIHCLVLFCPSHMF